MLSDYNIAYSYDLDPPTAPTNLVVGSVSASTVPLSWTASTDSESGMAGYEVQRAPDAAGVPGTWANVASGGCSGIVATISCTDSTVSPSTKYYYRVRGRDLGGNYSNFNTDGSGGAVTYSGLNTIHTFNSLGAANFTPPQGVTSVKALVVGGGGGGGYSEISNGGGGGGAGAVIINDAFAVSSQAYAVTVGDGGTNANGNNSVFSTITATGGGKGGHERFCRFCWRLWRWRRRMYILCRQRI